MQFILFLFFFLLSSEAILFQHASQLHAANEAWVPKTRKRERKPDNFAPRKKKEFKEGIAGNTRLQMAQEETIAFDASQLYKEEKPKEGIATRTRLQENIENGTVLAFDPSQLTPKRSKKRIKDNRKQCMFTPHKTSFLTSIESNVIATLKNIFERKTEGTIYINSFFFTNSDLAYALHDLKKKHPKINIVLLIDTLSQFHINKLLPIFSDAQIPVYQFPSTKEKLNHCKFIAWQYKSKKSGRNLYRVLSGSANFTLLGMEQNANFEHMTIHKMNEKDFNRFASITRDAIQESKLLNEDPVDNQFLFTEYPPLEPNPKHNTPKKKSNHYFSPIDDVEARIIDRINNTSQGGKISIITYAFDLLSITDALLNALSRKISVELIVDIYALNRQESQKRTPQQLEELQDKGATVLIYKDKGILKNHGKLILIEDGDRIICCQGSYNLTSTSKESFNNFEILGLITSKKILKEFKKDIRPHLLEKTTSFDSEKNYTSVKRAIL